MILEVRNSSGKRDTVRTAGQDSQKDAGLNVAVATTEEIKAALAMIRDIPILRTDAHSEQVVRDGGRVSIQDKDGHTVEKVVNLLIFLAARKEVLQKMPRTMAGYWAWRVAMGEPGDFEKDKKPETLH